MKSSGFSAAAADPGPGRAGGARLDVPLSALGRWGVAGPVAGEPGPYELPAGASGEDVRPRTTVVLDGVPAMPRPVLLRGLDAAAFDERSGIAPVGRTKLSADAVTPADGDLVTDRPDPLRLARVGFSG